LFRLLPLLALVTLTACTLPRYARYAEPPPPPPPPPVCESQPAPRRTLDTTRPKTDGTPYWVMSRVQGASTMSQEFGLQPVQSGKALLLVGMSSRDAKPLVVRRVEAAHVERPSPDEPQTDVQKVLVTLVPDGKIMGDAAVGMATVTGRAVSVDPSALIDEAISWDGHPALTPNGRWIVFASDRSGSLGGADLWYAPYSSGLIGAARPLYGANTACDELTPSVTSRGMLLFSSPGHTSHGGYDVHEARMVEEADSLRASNVLNVGTPINSAADEIFPFMLEDSTFYVASTRPDGREADRRDFDVLVLHRRQTLKQNITVIDIPQATLVGKVINTVTNMPVVDAEVIARLPQSTEVLASTRTDTAGSYRLRVPVERPVEITAQNEELFFDTFVTTIPASEQGRIVNPEKPLGLSPTFTLRVNFPTSVFDDPYPFSLDSNGTEIDRSWKRDVSDLVRNVKAGIGRIKKLVLTGHTDDVDTDESNLALSKKRVQFIIDRLVEGGLQAEILEGRSAGETQLLARRPDESVESWRRRCRRVELVKVQ
jgi:outer membrane protein OmpA-like peptidoglycan-associated protein